MRLTKASLATWRADTLKAQGSVCALCGDPFTAKNPAVGDHDHDTGQMRGVLHRGCNAMLGVIENGRARFQLKDLVRLMRVLKRIPTYISERRDDAPYYPTYRTDDEKRDLRNKRKRAARAARSAE